MSLKRRFHFYFTFFVSLSVFVQGALQVYNLTIHNGTRAPDGFSRQVYLINGQAPGPLIEVDEGDELEVFVQNDLPVETTIHWHGILQRGTPGMDGVPGVTQKPIQPGANFTYRFALVGEYGFYWYHSHFRAYSDDAIRGPLVIHPSPERAKPYVSLADDQSAFASMQEAEREAVPVLLSDWYHRVSDDIYNEYLTTGAFPNCVDSLLANGYGRVQCLPDYILAEPDMVGRSKDTSTPVTSAPTTMTSSMAVSTSMSTTSMNRMSMDDMSMSMEARAPTMDPSTKTPSHSTMSMSSMSPESTTMPGMGNMSMTTLTPRGCTPPMMFNSGYNASSLPHETCTNTTAPLLTIPANYTRGWLALNLVNGGSSSKLSVSMDAHSLLVYAADGNYVEPQEVQVLQISNGQRYSVMVKLDQMPGNYTFRLASYPYGEDMQQIIEGQATVMYQGDENMDIATDMTDHSPATWMLINGSATSNATELNERNLAPFKTLQPPFQADITYSFSVNQTEVTTWVINGTPYQEPRVPILNGASSQGWNASTTLHVPTNSTVDLIIRIANDSMDVMAHPLHLHGHRFWVLGTGTGSFPYMNTADAESSSPALLNLENPPYRDTTDIPESGWAVLRWVADNPGAWMFHCHVQWHLVSGMAVVFVVGSEDEIRGVLSGAGNETITGGVSALVARLTGFGWLAATSAAVAVSVASLLF